MLLKLERPTTKAKAYTEWESPPVAIMEDGEAKTIYESITNINNTNTNNSTNSTCYK
jgi:hypothetical protein